MTSSTETIFALATGVGRSAVAVLRLSGPGCQDILKAICAPLPAARRASLRHVRSTTGETLDQAVILWLPGPGTYTGEDCAELHLHGSRAVLAAVSARLIECGARPAEAGEFTRRAFINGRMDLVEAEGVADLIDAETESQRRQALRQMDGALSAIYTDWAARLRILLAHQEALIDFPDEDLPPEIEDQLKHDLRALQHEMALHLADKHRGEKLRDGLMLAVIGAPNVGKSSLVNALAHQEIAIVSPLAGTTRDIVETRLDIAGVKITLADTAGLRESQDLIEQEGVRRARLRAQDADLILVLTDASQPLPTESWMDNKAPPTGALVGQKILAIASKIDLAPAPPGYIGISTRTGAGMDELRHILAQAVEELAPNTGSPPMTRARHRAAVTQAADALHHASDAVLPELRGEDLRQAMQALGRITGTVGVEDLLDTVFSSFCIGK